jgi:hypothetical protein
LSASRQAALWLKWQAAWWVCEAARRCLDGEGGMHVARFWAQDTVEVQACLRTIGKRGGRWKCRPSRPAKAKRHAAARSLQAYQHPAHVCKCTCSSYNMTDPYFKPTCDGSKACLCLPSRGLCFHTGCQLLHIGFFGLLFHCCLGLLKQQEAFTSHSTRRT